MRSKGQRAKAKIVQTDEKTAVRVGNSTDFATFTLPDEPDAMPEPNAMLLFANCKINIGLDVLSRRADGYHEIATCMVPVRGLCDALEITPADEPQLAATGLPVDGDPARNLCMRAWRLLHERFGIGPVRIHLHKVVPMGAGLGGGSADGAFALRGLNDLFALGLDEEKLETLAAELGSDVPFFVRNEPALATGRGERLTSFPLPELAGKRLVIVKPDVFVSTAEAYAGVRPAIPGIPLAKRLKTPLSAWRGTVENAFERSVFERHPRLAEIKRQFYDMGALYASMSGSGSALYGIFADSVNPPSSFSEGFVYQQFVDEM